MWNNALREKFNFCFSMALGGISVSGGGGVGGAGRWVPFYGVLIFSWYFVIF